ncbi:MAG: dithiol-disulfide isomerase [Rhodospirillaceae bacterium]|nr:dithiol-disulfide isomerase [Rhodospirillaceae bacterium]
MEYNSNAITQIDLFSDLVCPWCFIGKKRLERALLLRKQCPVKINWRAFQLNPDIPKNGIPRDQYLAIKFGGKERATAIYNNIKLAGETERLDFNFEGIQRTPNTVLAHRLVLWSKQYKESDKIVESLFAAYFMEGRDIGSVETLREIAVASKLDAKAFDEYFSSDSGIHEIALERKYAYEIGIRSVPCFVFNRQFSVTGAQEPEAFLPLLDIKPSEQARLEI